RLRLLGLDLLSLLREVARAGLGLGRVVVIGEAVEAGAEDLPDEKAAAGLHPANDARGVRITPTVIANRLVAELRPLVQGDAVVGAGELAVVVVLNRFRVGVEVQLPGGRLAVLRRVAADAASFEDRPDVAVVFDRDDS